MAGGGWRRSQPLAGLRSIDVVIAAVAIAACVAAIPTVNPRGPLGVDVAANVIVAASLAWRRVAPPAMVIVATGTLAIQSLIGGSVSNTIAQFVLLLVLMFSFGLYTNGRRAMALAGAVALLCVYVVQAHDPSSTTADKIVSPLALLVLPTAAGMLLRRQQSTAARLRVMTVELERRRDADARTAVLAERARIAREVHDVVAHSVSVMLVQAGAAESMLDSDLTASRAALGSVREAGHDALVELRALLQLLGANSLNADTMPQPSLSQLERLVNQVRASGLEVDFQLDRCLDNNERLEPLSAGVELAAYRVVQEALTNIRKHAHATGARVVVSQHPHLVSIEVVDNGRADHEVAGVPIDGDPAATTPGRGLIGMRERVALYRGTFSAGPRASGGWQVNATLPCGGP